MVSEEIKSFNDLKGKDIGTVRGATSDIWLRQKLIDEKLDPERDVNLVNMDYLQMPAAVLAGRVAAASGAEPLIASFEAKGGRVLSYLTDTKLGDIDAVLCLLDAFIESDRPLAKAMVAGMAKASQDLQRDPDLVIETMASVVNLDTEIISKSLTNLAFTVKPDAAALGNLAEVLHDMKMIDRLPPIDEYLDLSLGQ
jgi:ABC-type nitrate/sulfonate/bicarbonate transport system substrate-binding protein